MVEGILPVAEPLGIKTLERDWFGGLCYFPMREQRRVVVLMRTWPADTIGGDWWQVWRERMVDLAAQHPGYSVVMYCVRQQKCIAGLVPS